MKRKNKKSLLLTVFLPILLSNYAFGQKNAGTTPLERLESNEEEQDTETVVEVDEGALQGYGAVRWGTASINKDWFPTTGARGAWLYRRDLAFGLDVTQLMGNYHPFLDPDQASIRQSLSTIGVFVEKVFGPTKRLHPYANIVIGRGFSSFFHPDSSKELPEDLKSSRAFAFASPGAGLALNMTKYTRVLSGFSVMLPFAGHGNKQIKEDKFLGGYLYIGFGIGNF